MQGSQYSTMRVLGMVRSWNQPDVGALSAAVHERASWMVYLTCLDREAGEYMDC